MPRIRERVHPLLALRAPNALVPVFNPHDADKGISSQHHVPSAGPVSATTTNTAVARSSPATNSFWHPVGTIVSSALSYYMGNDPCRTVDRTRRRLGAGEDCVGTDDTLERHVTWATEETEPDDRSNPRHEELLSKLASATGMKVVEEAAQGGQQQIEACALKRETPVPEDNTQVRTGPKAPPGTPAPECADPEGTGAQEWTVYGLGGVMLLALMVMALR